MFDKIYNMPVRLNILDILLQHRFEYVVRGEGVYLDFCANQQLKKFFFITSREIERLQHKPSQGGEQLLVEPSFLKESVLMSMASNVGTPNNSFVFNVISKAFAYPAFSIHRSNGSHSFFPYSQTRLPQLLL